MLHTYSIPESITWNDDHLTILNQQKLPNNIEYIDLYKIDDFYEAIVSSKVKNSAAIEITAAYGLAVAAISCETENPKEFVTYFQKHKDYLASSKPALQNISNVLKRLEKVVRNATSINEAKTNLLHTAIRIQIELEDRSRETQ